MARKPAIRSRAGAYQPGGIHGVNGSHAYGSERPYNYNNNNNNNNNNHDNVYGAVIMT